MTTEIPLTHGYVALVDDDDAEVVCRHNWYAQVPTHGRTAYVRTAVRDAATGKQKQIRMHRLIMGVPAGIEVDHIDGNGVNNCRSNLRIATHAQNVANQRRPRTNTSGYKGVFVVPVRLKSGQTQWYACITHDGRQIYGKHRVSPIEAAHEYDDLAREYFGEFARLNFPLEGEQAA